MLKWHRVRRLRWLGLGLLLVILAGVGLLWLLRGGERVDQAWQRMKAEGTLRVGLDASYPPFEWLDEATGEMKGYDIDLAREMGRRLGVQVTFVNIGFDSLYDAVRSGKVDAVVSGVPYDPTMTESVSYGAWYFNAGQFLVVRTGDTRIKSVNDLPSHNLGVELGSTGDLEARRLQGRIRGLQLATYPTAEDALKALVDEKVDTALVDAVSAYVFMAHGGRVTLVGDAVLDESYAVVTNRKSAQLRTAVDAVIMGMRGDGFLDSLRDKWLLGTPAP